MDRNSQGKTKIAMIQNNILGQDRYAKRLRRSEVIPKRELVGNWFTTGRKLENRL